MSNKNEMLQPMATMTVQSIEKGLESALLCAELRPFDLQFMHHMSQLNQEKVPELMLATALLSNRLAAGDSCVALDLCNRYELFHNREISPKIEIPSTQFWVDILRQQFIVGNSAEHKPLILTDRNMLYLGRYWQLEDNLIKALNRRVGKPDQLVDEAVLKDGLSRLFRDQSETDWQKIAAANAVYRQFSVITGGPGTGKTYTVAAVVALLLEQHVARREKSQQSKPLRIALAAPTGKAAARLSETIHQAASKMPLHSDIVQSMALEAVTLHRLLRMMPGRVEPWHDKNRPLAFDIVIVDEASMVDLPLMARAFQALPDSCQLILLGDKNQLSSVESGRVLGDICGVFETTQLGERAAQKLAAVTGQAVKGHHPPPAAISDHIVYLHQSHRSQDSGGIAALAEAVNQGDYASCMRLFKLKRHANLQWFAGEPDDIEQVLKTWLLPVTQKIVDSTAPLDALKRLGEVCVLCALRGGRTGVRGINQQMQSLLKDGDLAPKSEEYYPGLPVMITRNSPTHRLSNGDRGITLRHAVESGRAGSTDDGSIRVYFDGALGVRSFAPQRLPTHERHFAMTIHKSQGSEYETVVVVLPEQDHPLLSRELLYTAVTRARKNIIVVAAAEPLKVCIERRVKRVSGLRDALWPDQNGKLPKPSLAKPVQETLDF